MRSLIVHAIAWMLLSTVTHARLSLYYSNGGGIIVQQQLVSGKWRLSVKSTDTGASTYWQVRADDVGENIEYLHIENATGFPTVVWVTPLTGGDSWNTIELIDRIGANTNPVAIYDLQCTGGVGSISCSNLNNADIGGSVTGDITAVAVSSGDSVVGNLRVRGSLLGNVTAQYGNIGTVDVDGDIGASGSPVNIWVRDYAQVIKSRNGAIYADIDANHYNSTGDLGRIEAGGTIISGTIDADAFSSFGGAVANPGVFTSGTGNLGANITLQSAMDKSIRIGGSFNSGKTITLPADGLTGQIIFNNANTSATWSGSISVGGSGLTSAPYYTDLASDIGDGSAGLATFHAHLSSCEPADGSTVVIRTWDPDYIGEGDPPCLDAEFMYAHVRFYGPIALTGDAVHCTVEKWNGSSWGSTGWSVIDVVAGPGDRFLRVGKANDSAWGSGLYRIKDINERIKSAGVTGTPYVDHFDVEFTLDDNCTQGYRAMFDQNSDTYLNATDAVHWATHLRDLNRDGLTNGADLALLLRMINVFGN